MEIYQLDSGKLIYSNIFSDCTLSLATGQVWILSGACEKVASDLRVRRVFLPGTSVSSTTYNWLVMI